MQDGPPSAIGVVDQSPFSGPITTGPLQPGPPSSGPLLAGVSFAGPFDSEPFLPSAHTGCPMPAVPPQAGAAAAKPETASVPTNTVANATIDTPATAASGASATAATADLESTTWSIEPNLRARGPAYAVMRECLNRQQEASHRGRLARVFGLSPLHPNARSWYSGALGEIVVANVLAQLGAEWTVLHAVPVGSNGADIDHVILGPGGIFTINTKNHSGKKIWIGGSTFLVNGYKQDYMRNSAHEAERAARLLSAVTGRPVTVTPLIVVVNPASITTGRKRPRVTVLTSNTLKRWLLRRPQVLSDRAVAHFSMFAEERSTWRPEPMTIEDTSEQMIRFERLRAEVDAARQRARLWLLAVGVGAILVSPVAFAQIFRLLLPLMVVPGS
ncbi:MAG: NERD domain-containing protein [Actinomycetota bacterium]